MHVTASIPAVPELFSAAAPSGPLLQCFPHTKQHPPVRATAHCHEWDCQTGGHWAPVHMAAYG